MKCQPKTLYDILNDATERDLKEAIIDLVNDNEYFQKENRRLEDELDSRPVNIFIDRTLPPKARQAAVQVIKMILK